MFWSGLWVCNNTHVITKTGTYTPISIKMCVDIVDCKDLIVFLCKQYSVLSVSLWCLLFVISVEIPWNLPSDQWHTVNALPHIHVHVYIDNKQCDAMKIEQNCQSKFFKFEIGLWFLKIIIKSLLLAIITF